MLTRVALCGHVVAEVAASGESIDSIGVEAVVEAGAAEEGHEGVRGVGVHDKDDDEECDDHPPAQVGADTGVLVLPFDQGRSRRAVSGITQERLQLSRGAALNGYVGLLRRESCLRGEGDLFPPKVLPQLVNGQPDEWSHSQKNKGD